MIDDEALRTLGQRLVEVDAVVGVLLGGSRAREEHTRESDFDLGLYYRPPLDIEALEDLARDVAGPKASVTRPGEWGPWVDGGGWLHIGGTAVDWIYRDLDRVRKSWDDAQAGRNDFHFQIGHPLGVPDFMYAGEVALGVVLADPSGEITTLQEAAVVIHHACGTPWSKGCGRHLSASRSLARQSPAEIRHTSQDVCSG